MATKRTQSSSSTYLDDPFRHNDYCRRGRVPRAGCDRSVASQPRHTHVEQHPDSFRRHHFRLSTGSSRVRQRITCDQADSRNGGFKHVQEVRFLFLAGRDDLVFCIGILMVQRPEDGRHFYSHLGPLHSGLWNIFQADGDGGERQ